MYIMITVDDIVQAKVIAEDYSNIPQLDDS